MNQRQSLIFFVAGAMDMADEVVDIEDIVGASLKMINEGAERAGVDLRADIPDGLPPLRGIRSASSKSA